MREYSQLSLKERRQIEEAYKSGLSVMEIGRIVGRSRGTIYRELKKGYTGKTDQNMRDGYSAEIGQAKQNAVRVQAKLRFRKVANEKWDEYRKQNGGTV